MKTNKKENKYLYPFVVVGLVALMLTAFIARADSSFLDKVAQFVGITVGNNLNQKINDSGVLENMNVDDLLGSAAGNTFEQSVNFYRGFVKGGKVLNASTTLLMAKTLTAAEVCNNGTITVNSAATTATLSAASLDITMPATSTLFSECLKSEGDEIRFDFLNQSPTAATTTEMVQGTGCTQVIGVADGDDLIPGQKGATITIKRNTDWLADGGSSDCIVRIYEWN